MNIRKRHQEFEDLVSSIFNQYSIETSQNQFVNNYEVDIMLQKDGVSRVYVEVKIYRSRRIHISQIKRALDRMLKIIKEGDLKSGVLVITSLIDSEIKDSLEREYGIIIWDRTSLFYLTESFPDLRSKLESQLVNLSEDSNEDVFEGIRLNLEDLNLSELFDSTPKQAEPQITKGEFLCAELNKIPSGKKKYREFELKCQEVLEYLFENDLTAWHNQARTDDSLNQFDLICRISSTHDFWRSLSRNFNCRYVLFEFKNYKDKIKQGQVYTTEKYLFNKALRSVGFIIAKNGSDKNAIIAMKGALREHGKLIIPLTPKDLCEMLNRKDTGDDPSTYLSEVVDDFLIKLSR